MTETTDDSSGKLDGKVSRNEKLAIDEEKYDTNWCDMPAEIKLKCIGTMDFGMRCQLRQTARAENQLVDSLRYKFDLIYLKNDKFFLYKVTTDEEYYTPKHFYNRANSSTDDQINNRSPNLVSVNMLPYLLKHCDFELFYFKSCELLNRIKFGKLDTVLRPKTIECYFEENHDINTIIEFFKNCWNEVEKITMHVSSYDIPFELLFAIPSVFNAVNLYASCRQPTDLIPVIEKWIEIDAQVGTEFHILSKLSELPLLFDHFQDRVISREDSTMRMRTDNSNKHILIKFTDDEFPFFCGTVVPSDIQ